jgi:hypothetical protein
MRVGIVGGLDRSEQVYQRAVRALGHEVEHHTGYMRGQASHALAQLVERSDLVVIITDVNSHGAVQTTRRLLRERPRPAVLVRRLGLSRLVALVESHASELAAANAAGT